LIKNFPPKADQPMVEKFKIKNSRKGFTLIEILIAMAIVAVIASAVLVNVGKNDDRDARLEADRVATFIREVQNSALAGDYVSGSTGKVCGFGVYENSTSELWVYYTETSGTTPQDVNCSSVAKQYPGASYKIADRVLVLGNGVAVKAHAEDPVVPFDVFFDIPSGKVTLNDGVKNCTTNPSFSITLQKGSSSVAVKVECSGRISIQ
jgi:type II secretion system protein I